jgi:hypothetical protein
VRAVFRWMEASSERWAIADIVTLSAGAGLSQLTHAVAWLGFLGTLIFSLAYAHAVWGLLVSATHLASACGPPSQEILPMAFLAPIVVGTVFAFAVPNVVVAAIACLTNIWFDRRRSRRCRELDVRYELRLRRRKEGGYPF